MPSSIAENLAEIRGEIAAAAQIAGRDAGEIELIAVSKTHPPEAILEVLEAGQTVFGESRVQEARAKAALLPAQARWRLIGHLQSNKVRQALPLFEQIHSVDSLNLAYELNRVAVELGLFPKVLLEVNIAGEESKFGFTPEALRGVSEELLALERLEIAGLMAIPPYADDPEAARPHFVALREFRDQLASDWGAPLPQLSMGMSGDYAVAVEEGATQVRVGTALFGHRQGKTWRGE